MVNPTNKYTLQEDKMMYELREVKIKLGTQNQSADEINQNGAIISKKYGLKPAVEIKMVGQLTSPN